MTLKRVNDFSTEDPARLDRELSQLEDNLDAEFRLIRKEMAPQARVSTFVPMGVDSIRAIQPDQQLSVDTSILSGAVVFPPLSPENYGRRFTLIKRKAANNIVTSCQDTAVFCNAAAFPTLAAVGVYVFFCDSTGYYR